MAFGELARALESSTKRRQRYRSQLQKAQQSPQDYRKSLAEVTAFHERRKVLSSIHRQCGGRIDWSVRASEPEPQKPARDDKTSTAARSALESYEPGFLDKALRREMSRRIDLEKALEAAVAADEYRYTQAMDEWRDNHESWKRQHLIAERMLARDEAVILSFVESSDFVRVLDRLGTNVSFSLLGIDTIKATIQVNAFALLPHESTRTLVNRGASVKPMPKSHWRMIHLDYACGCVVRVAREVFASLPLDRAVIVALDSVESKLGIGDARVPIISVLVSRSDMTHIDFNNLSAYSIILKLNHRLDFTERRGFRAIVELESGH